MAVPKKRISKAKKKNRKNYWKKKVHYQALNALKIAKFCLNKNLL